MTEPLTPAIAEIETELDARASVPPRLTKEETDRRRLENEHVLKQQPHSLWYYSWRRLKRNKLAMLGIGYYYRAYFHRRLASFLAPFDPNMQVLEYSTKSIGLRVMS